MFEWRTFSFAVLLAIVWAWGAGAVLEKRHQQHYCENAGYSQPISENTLSLLLSGRAGTPAEQGAFRRCQEDHPSPWRSWWRHFFDINLGDALIAAFTLVLSIATVLLWIETRRLAKGAERQAKDFARQTNLLVAVERPNFHSEEWKFSLHWTKGSAAVEGKRFLADSLKLKGGYIQKSRSPTAAKRVQFFLRSPPFGMHVPVSRPRKIFASPVRTSAAS